MRSRILLLPEFSDPAKLNDVLARAAFHLAYVKPETLTFVVDNGMGEAASEAIRRLSISEDLDPVIEEQVRRVFDRIALVEVGTGEAERIGDLSDIVGVWDSAAFDHSEWVLEAGRRIPNQSLFDLDPRTNPAEAEVFAHLGHAIDAPPVAAEQARFLRMLTAIGDAHNVFVFAGPPSLDPDTFAPGVRIVTDSVILDADFVRRIKPHMVTLSDPAAHFGPSAFAARIRTELHRALARDPELWGVVPLEHRGFLVDLLPEHAERIVGVPMLAPDMPVVLDLRRRFGVTSLPGTLPLAIALAATIGDRISVVAFDKTHLEERALAESDRVAMQLIHPALFDAKNGGDEEKVAAVEKIVQACEAVGIKVDSRESSSMPPLRRRSGPPDTLSEWRVPKGFASHAGEALVWIDPDWVSDFGHYGHWYRALAKEAGHLEIPIVSLAARGFDTTGRDDVLAAFTYPTVNADASRLYAPRFEAELETAISRLLEQAPDIQLVLAFYTADVWHLPPLIRVASRYAGRIRVVANLMRSHQAVLKSAAVPGDELDWWGQALGRLVELGRTAGVTVTVDTDALAEVVSDVARVELEIWPMASVTRVRPRRREHASARVVFFSPGLPQHSKGALEFAQAATTMLARESGENAVFRMRSVEQPTGTDNRIVREIKAAAAAGVEVVSGVLSIDDHSAEVESADVIVIPYRTDPFRTRTHAAITDAMRAGKPVVVASGTWGAQVAASAGTGVEFRSGDAADLARAMGEAANRLETLTARAVAAAPQIEERFSMGHLLKFIRSAKAAEPAIDAERIIAAATDIESVFAAYHSGLSESRRADRGWAMHRSKSIAKADQANRQLSHRIEELERALSDRARRYDRSKQGEKKARSAADTTAAELTVAERKAADLERLVDEANRREAQLERLVSEANRSEAQLERLVYELEHERSNRLVARLKRRFRLS